MSKKAKLIFLSIYIPSVAIIIIFVVLANMTVNKEPLVFDGESDDQTEIIIIPEDEILGVEDYTPKDVLGITLGKITTTSEFEVTTTGESNATGQTIKIANHRIVKNNEAFIECVSAGLVSSGTQRFFSGGNVGIRKASSVNADATATFNSDTVEVITDETYKSRYGWLPYQMNGYIFSDNTYLSDPTISKNEDNTYTINVELDPDSDAAYYYQREVSTSANATTVPVFYEMKFEITIDENFRVLKVKTHEKYDVTVKVIIDIKSTTTTECVDIYNYTNINFDSNLYDFFKGKLTN